MLSYTLNCLLLSLLLTILQYIYVICFSELCHYHFQTYRLVNGYQRQEKGSNHGENLSTLASSRFLNLLHRFLGELSRTLNFSRVIICLSSLDLSYFVCKYSYYIYRMGLLYVILSHFVTI